MGISTTIMRKHISQILISSNYSTMSTRWNHSLVMRTELLTLVRRIRPLMMSTFAIGVGSSYNFKWTETKFKGVHLSLNKENNLDMLLNPHKFYNYLQADLNGLKAADRSAAFIKVPIEQSTFISTAAKLGFTFHHSKADYSILSLWLREEIPNKIPHYATHQVGVSGAVYDEESGMALVVQDKNKMPMWKFPGGFSEPGEDLAATAVREVKEETNISADYKALLVFRQQHNVRFGQSDLYFICRLTPLSYNIEKCNDEIEKCQWMHLNELLCNQESTPLTKYVARLLLHGVEYGYDKIDVSQMEMESWASPTSSFKVFSRGIIE